MWRQVFNVPEITGRLETGRHNNLVAASF